MTNKKETQQDNQDREKQQRVAKEIQDVLESNKMALQPYLEQSPYGIVPRVQLVDIPNEDDGQTTDGEEAGEDTASEGATEPAES